MALKIYKYGNRTYQIADEDLALYPGAVLVEEPKPKTAKAPANKAKRPAKNKKAAEAGDQK